MPLCCRDHVLHWWICRSEEETRGWHASYLPSICRMDITRIAALQCELRVTDDLPTKSNHLIQMIIKLLGCFRAFVLVVMAVTWLIFRRLVISRCHGNVMAPFGPITMVK